MSGVVVRAPNHLGDLVMALPALRALAGADVLVLRWLIPILSMAREADPAGAGIGEILPMARGTRGMLDAARRLIRRGYDLGIVLPPSISSALVFAAGRVRRRRGFPTDARRLLLTEPIQALPTGEHRATGFMLLATGEARRPTAVLGIPERERERWRKIVGPMDGPLVGVCPGSHAASRRWDPERYAEVVRRLARQGLRVVVFGGPGEGELMRFVSGGNALEVGGTPDLPLLAAGLADCTVALTNDSGPMHVAAAVGTPTVALIGASDPRLTGPLGEGHLLMLADECDPTLDGAAASVRARHEPASSGAENDRMRLISVDRVEAAVLGQLARHPTRGE